MPEGTCSINQNPKTQEKKIQCLHFLKRNLKFSTQILGHDKQDFSQSHYMSVIFFSLFYLDIHLLTVLFLYCACLQWSHTTSPFVCPIACFSVLQGHKNQVKERLARDSETDMSIQAFPALPLASFLFMLMDLYICLQHNMSYHGIFSNPPTGKCLTSRQAEEELSVQIYSS